MSKSLFLNVKLDILQRHSRGRGAVSIGKALNLAQSTLSIVLKNVDIIHSAAENVSALSARSITKVCHPVTEEMERLLALWGMTQSVENAMSDIQATALSLYVTVKKRGIGGLDYKDTFVASHD